MSLFTALRLATYLLVVLALAALALSGLVDGLVAALVGVATLATWWRARPVWLPVAGTGRWALLGAAVGLAALDLAWLAGSAAEALARWLLAALLARLMLRGVGRDTRDVVLVAFVLLVTASSVSPGLPAMTLFVAFLVVAGWAAMLQHLVSEDEAAGPRAGEALRLGRGLWVLGALSTAATLAIGLALFFVIPRVGPAALLRPATIRMTTGFAESVELGAIGELERDTTIAMRVRVPGAFPPAVEGELRWRGVVLDRFDGVRWTASPGRRTPRPPAAPGTFVLGPARPGGVRVAQDITLEPLGTDVLFTAPRAVRLALAADVIVTDDAGAVTVPGMTGRLRYVVDSDVERTTGGGEPLSDVARARYLQLPPLAERIAGLAARVAAGAHGPADAAARLTAFLSGGEFRYTLVLERRTALDPLDEFLFVRRAGNCEYFAAALAVMLRTLGIPSRVVNGFQRGEWNPHGGYYVVRLADAHAWVEAYAGSDGWISLDPSPPDTSARARPWAAAGLYLDALRERWLRGVADWSLSDQVGALATLRAWMQPGTLGVAAAGVLALGVLVAVTARRRPWTRAAEARGLPPFYRRSLRLLARRGRRPAPAETAREFCQRVGRECPAGAAALARLTEAYERRRFGAAPATPAEERALAADLAALRAAARLTLRRRR